MSSIRRNPPGLLLLLELVLRPPNSSHLLQSSAKQAISILVMVAGTPIDDLIVRTRTRIHRSLQWRSFVFTSFTNESTFRSHFRMTRPAFAKLLGILEPHITKTETKFGKPIPAAVRLAVYLVFCGHGCSLHILSALFGIGRSTASVIVRDVSCAIVKRMTNYIAFPSTREKLLKCSIGFEDGYGIPGCVGTLDGCHISIVQPSVPTSKKYRKSFYSFNVSAIVDRTRRFLDVDVRWPGSVGDSRVFNNSAVGRIHEDLFSRLGGADGADQLLTGQDEQCKIPFFLLADPAYANTKHLVTTFEIAEAESNVVVVRQNKALAGMRYPVECAFGILKGRWRLVGKPIEMARTNLEAVPTLISSVCILHNFVIDMGDCVWDERAEARQRAFYFTNFKGTTDENSDRSNVYVKNKTRDSLLKWVEFRDSVRAS